MFIGILQCKCKECRYNWLKASSCGSQCESQPIWACCLNFMFLLSPWFSAQRELRSLTATWTGSDDEAAQGKYLIHQLGYARSRLSSHTSRARALSPVVVPCSRPGSHPSLDSPSGRDSRFISNQTWSLWIVFLSRNIDQGEEVSVGLDGWRLTCLTCR